MQISGTVIKESFAKNCDCDGEFTTEVGCLKCAAFRKTIVFENARVHGIEVPRYTMVLS